MKKLIVSLLLLALSLPAHAAEKETAYERVMRTKTMRCGYLVYEPYIIKNLKTGALSGVTVDYINILAKEAGISVDWSSEINIDQIVPSLDNGRIDVSCIPVTPDNNWKKVLKFGASWGALPYYVYVPVDSTLDKKTLETAKFVTVDGYAHTTITRDIFPRASFLSLPQTTSVAEFYDQLRYKKADAHVNEHISAEKYMKENPGIIKKFSDKPIIAMRMFFATQMDDKAMSDFMNRTFSTDDPRHTEILKGLMKTYNVPDDSILLGEKCKPYVDQKGQEVCALE